MTSTTTTTASSSTSPPQTYLHQLAQSIRQHQFALAAAAALPSRRHPSSSSSSPPGQSSSWSTLGALTTGFGLLPSISASTNSSAPLTLTLDPHHLYYLLLKFEEIGLQPGSLDINLRDAEHCQTGMRFYDPTCYMTGFERIDQAKPIDRSDTMSLFSNLSNISLGSTWWNGSGGSGKGMLGSFRARPQPSRSVEEEVKYIYSTFTKLPSLRLSPTSSSSLGLASPPRSMQLLEGFTDLPNANGVPLRCFKSLWTLTIHDLDPRTFVGWDHLSQSLRSLEIRRSGLEDLERLLVDAVMADVQHQAKAELNQQDLAAEAEENDGVLPHLTDTEVLSQSPTDIVHPSPPALSFPPLAWRFLQHLCLADNGLTFIPASALAALVSLTSLDLSSNLLIAVPAGLGSLSRLRSLSLADNMIDSVLGIYQSLGNVGISSHVLEWA